MTEEQIQKVKISNSLKYFTERTGNLSIEILEGKELPNNY